jgi:hypothetical protein
VLGEAEVRHSNRLVAFQRTKNGICEVLPRFDKLQGILVGEQGPDSHQAENDIERKMSRPTSSVSCRHIPSRSDLRSFYYGLVGKNRNYEKENR